MKFLLVLLAAPLFATAQSVDIKDVDTSDSEATTIEIRKGKKAEEFKTDAKKWDMSEGSTEVEGEAAATAKEAKANWVKACKDWKKEFKEETKENGNIPVTMDCGSKPVCGGEAGNKVCTSTATYKIKTRVD